MCFNQGESWHWQIATQQQVGEDWPTLVRHQLFIRDQPSSALVPINLLVLAKQTLTAGVTLDGNILILKTLKTNHPLVWQIQWEELVGCFDGFRWSGNFLLLNAVQWRGSTTLSLCYLGAEMISDHWSPQKSNWWFRHHLVRQLLGKIFSYYWGKHGQWQEHRNIFCKRKIIRLVVIDRN